MPAKDHHPPKSNRSRADARVPPHDLAAEAAALGAALLNADAAAGLPDPARFYKPAHQFIAAAIGKLESGTVDVVTVADQLRRDGLLDEVGDLDGLVDLISTTPSIGQWPAYARIVNNTWQLRDIIAAGAAIADLGYSAPDDVAAALARARGDLDQITVE
ncbi:MAG TPA: DnaB-like helicase N-terminal domain-containing protein, partial [Ilumatobacteraceae bacterium]|nr:DnaB-like helicase N-terminal domain-containing protein [Ilumatobacteraceae bacterium]